MILADERRSINAGSPPQIACGPLHVKTIMAAAARPCTPRLAEDTGASRSQVGPSAGARCSAGLTTDACIASPRFHTGAKRVAGECPAPSQASRDRRRFDRRGACASGAADQSRRPRAGSEMFDRRPPRSTMVACGTPCPRLSCRPCWGLRADRACSEAAIAVSERRVALVRILQRHGHQRAALQIDRMFGFVRHMRPAVLNLRDLGVRITGTAPPYWRSFDDLSKRASTVGVGVDAGDASRRVSSRLGLQQYRRSMRRNGGVCLQVVASIATVRPSSDRRPRGVVGTPTPPCDAIVSRRSAKSEDIRCA